MTIKFTQLTPATYSVVKTEGLIEQPTGTEIQDALSIVPGSYTAAELPVETPDTTATYWMAVTETVEDIETTTYTTWVITKVTSDSKEYVQYRLISANWTTNISDWQGEDDMPLLNSKNFVESNGIYLSTALPKIIPIGIDSMHNNRYITINGTIGSIYGYSYCDPILIEEAGIVILKCALGTTGAAISLLESKLLVSLKPMAIGVNNSKILYYSCFVKSGSYVVFCWRSTYKVEALLLTSGYSEAISENTEAIRKMHVSENDTEYDLAIKDGEGSILALFQNGDFKTKNFDSSNLTGILNVTSRYIGKKMSILGDSISTFGDPDSRNENGTYCYSYYPTETCRYSTDGTVGSYQSIKFDVEDTYWMKLIRATGMVLGINESWRGSKVSGSGNSAFNNQSRINHLGTNGTPDVILVYGGSNDAGGGVSIGTFNTENPQNYTDEQITALPVSTFADGYRTMLIRLMNTYPFAEIVVILPTFTTSYYTITNLDLYVEIIKEACDFFGIKYIDARCTGINIYNRASYMVDGIHPNTNGMKLLFEKIYKQLIFV